MLVEELRMAAEEAGDLFGVHCFSYLDRSLEDSLRGAFIHTALSPPAKRWSTLRRASPPAPANRAGRARCPTRPRARPRAAGQRLAAPRSHTRSAMRCRLAPAGSRHSRGGKARVMLEQRPLRRHRRRTRRRPRTARREDSHRQNRYLCGFPVNFNSFYQRRAEGRRPHLDANLAVASSRGTIGPAQRLDAESRARSEAFLVHELHEAARPCRMLDLAAVGVERCGSGVHAASLRPLNHQDLVCANAKCRSASRWI